MPRRINLQFEGGVSRIRGAEDLNYNRPYDLNNARVEDRDVVVALRAGSEGPLIGGCKPWFKLNDSFITCRDCVNDADFHNGRLYAVGCNGDCPETSPPTCGRIQVFPECYVPSSNNDYERAEIDVPRVLQVTVIQQCGGVPVGEGVADGSFVTYLLIPVNEHDEAGEWAYAYYQNTTGGDCNVELEILANSLTHKVEIYRSAAFDSLTGRPSGLDTTCGVKQYYRIGEATQGVCAGVPVLGCDDHVATYYDLDQDLDANCDLVSDPGNTARIYSASIGDGSALVGQTLYFTKTLGTFPQAGFPFVITGGGISYVTVGTTFDYYPEIAVVGTSQDQEGGCNIVFEDFAEFVICDPGSEPDQGELGFRFLDDNCILANADEGNTCFPSQPVLSRTRNVHDSSQAYKGFCASAVHNDAGTMMYGGVRWPTKEVDVGLLETGGGVDLIIQYEYHTPKGEVCGPQLQLMDVRRLVVEFGGSETALLVWRQDTLGQYRLIERISSIDGGRYVSSCGTCFTFDFSSSPQPSIQAQAGPCEAQDCIEEGNAVFLGASLRPLEITYEQFRVPAKEEVRAIVPARLAEEEDLRSYTFYVMTDRSLYVGRRDGRAVTLESLSANFGVAQGFDGQALVCPVRYGVVLHGTDNHLYYMTGRQLTALDTSTVEHEDRSSFLDLWDDVYDFAYHVRFGELWVATDTGVWVFGLDRRSGWVANYNLNGVDGQVKRIFYDPDETLNGEVGHMLFGDRVEQGTGGTYYMDNSGAYLADPSVTTQFLQDDPRRTAYDRMEVVYRHMPLTRLPGGAGVIRMEVTESVRDVSIDSAHQRQRSYNIDPETPYYNRLHGGAHQFTFAEFEEVSYVEFMSDRKAGNN